MGKVPPAETLRQNKLPNPKSKEKNMTTAANPQEAKMTDTGDNPQEVRLALSKLANCPPEPHPELNGYLLQSDNLDPIYLVVDGKRCHVPDPQTFKNLFIDGTRASQSPLIDVVILGTPLETGALLIKADGDPTYYLLSNGMKRGIPNPTILGQYKFDSAKVRSFPKIVINSIKDGPNIPGRS